MTDKTMTLEQVKEAYARGFMAACKWPSPVTQDVDSDAFRVEREEDLSDMTFSQTAERGEAVAWPAKVVAGSDGVSLQGGYEFLPLDEKEAAVWNRCIDECRKASAAPPPAPGVPDVGHLKDLICGFGYTTQSQSWDLAEAVIGALSATPSPATDVAAVREVIADLRNRADVPAIIRANELADKLARAIGDAK